MVKVFKSHLSLCAVTTAVLFFAHNAGAKVERNNATNNTVQANAIVNAMAENGENQVSCNESAPFYRCNDGAVHEISNKFYSLTNKMPNGIDAAIEVSEKGTNVRGNNIKVNGTLSANGNSEKDFLQYGVKVSNTAGLSLNNSALRNILVGVKAHKGGTVTLFGGSIDAMETGISIVRDVSDSSSSVYLTNTKITTGGVGVKVKGKGHFISNGASITDEGHQMMNAENYNNNSAFHILQGGFVEFSNGGVDVVNAHGLLLQEGNESQADIKNSTITVKGNTFYGMRFLGEEKLLNDESKKTSPPQARINLIKTVFAVPNSAALYSTKFYSIIKFSQDSKISGDLLLRAEENSTVKIIADASTLIGRTHVDENATATLRLQNKSKWILSRPKYKKMPDSASSGSQLGNYSFISSVDLDNSFIIFEKSKSDTINDYQTLRIGKGEGIVYEAFGDPWILLNARLNPNDTSDSQVTDRLVIHGDVKGKTIVHVQGVSGNVGEGNSENAHSVPIIQVYGNACLDSFQLNGQYVALNGAPYKYVLRSYSPKATVEQEHIRQKFVQNGGKFWNFRLENEYVQTSGDGKHTPTVLKRTPPADIPVTDIVPVSSEGVALEAGSVLPQKAVRSVVPQVPTYLLLPNGLFHAGLVDINNQNKQLETLRTTSSGMLEIRENPASFFRGYGGSYHYASDLSALEYGYGGDFNYNAIEAGILLRTIENADSAISFGVMGTYGKLSLQPQDVKQSQKSSFDKWTATAYGSMQHDAGFYVDGLFSYGLLKGDVLTLARGKTATLKSHPLSASLTVGKAFMTGHKGFVFDPQIQIVYQNLRFDKASDVDGFDIEMKKPDQWVMRVGGRLTKTLAASEEGRVVSFNGKLHFTHGFGEKQTVHFKDAFQLGAFGSSLEAGLGVNARLSSKFAFHGDLVYQHKLTKAGFSGVSFSGGLRYQF
ncbi:autotransporter outer membrane beta-barrel domain-containing protein [Bartonella heixiaziensis]|uniref:autotransporter outer membrane beta-barrel domain-containing protein n=1 Tax=Bartonella heixiaziensis TaxID=1461000 RepID=UPI003908B8D9